MTRRQKPRVEGSLSARLTGRAAERDANRARADGAREARKVIREWEKTFGAPPADRRGGFGPAAGRIGWPMRLPPMITTSAQLCSVYPFVADPGFGVDAPLIGLDVYSRTTFAFGVHEFYRAGVITSPNMCVTGEIGTGKSSLLKTLAFRGLPFGVHTSIVDIKGEYDQLARVAGIIPVQIGPGLPTTLNPLAEIRRDPSFSADQHRQLQRARRVLLLQGLLEIQIGRPLGTAEQTLIGYALDDVTGEDSGETRVAVPTLSRVLAAMSAPERWAHRLDRSHYDLVQFQAESGEVRLALDGLISGPLGGIFDSADGAGASLDYSQPGTILDLRSLRSNDQLAAMAMTCAQSWLEAELTRPDSPPRLCVYDEFALIAGNLALMARMREQFKLARALGVANLVAFHRFDSLRAGAAAGSALDRITTELIEDCGVRISYRQSSGSLDAARTYMGTSDTQTDLLRHLRQGVGLWRIGTRPFVVKHQLSRVETAMVNTDSRMLTRPTTDISDVEFDARLADAMGGTR